MAGGESADEKNRVLKVAGEIGAPAAGGGVAGATAWPMKVMFGTGGRQAKELTGMLTAAPLASETVIVVLPPATAVTVKAIEVPFAIGGETSTNCGSVTVTVAVPRMPETSTCAGIVLEGEMLAGLADRPGDVASGAEAGPPPQAVRVRMSAAQAEAARARRLPDMVHLFN